MDLKDHKPDLSRKFPGLRKKDGKYAYRDVIVWYLRQEWGMDIKALPPQLRLRSNKLIEWNQKKGLSPIITAVDLMKNYWKKDLERWDGVM